MEKCKWIKWEDALCLLLSCDSGGAENCGLHSPRLRDTMKKNGSHWADLLFIWLLSNPFVSDEFRHSWIDLVGLAALGVSLGSGSNIDYEEGKHSQPKLVHSSSAPLCLCWTLVQTLGHRRLVLWHRIIIYISLALSWGFLWTLHAWDIQFALKESCPWDRSIVWGTYVSLPVPCRGCMTCESHTGIVIHIDKRKKSRTQIRSNARVNVSFCKEDGMLSDCFLWPASVELVNLCQSDEWVGPAAERAPDLSILLYRTRWSLFGSAGGVQNVYSRTEKRVEPTSCEANLIGQKDSKSHGSHGIFSPWRSCIQKPSKVEMLRPSWLHLHGGQVLW